MKKFIRTIGIDDAYSENSESAFLVAVVVRGKDLIESIATEKIEIDGLDATEKIISLVKKFSLEQIKAIFLSGITFAGFNIANIEEIYEKLKIPVIVLISKNPNFEKIEEALKENFEDWEIRMNIIKSAGEVYKIGNIYCQLKGISLEKAKEIINLAKRNKFPESLRIAHLIASALATGKSKKKI